MQEVLSIKLSDPVFEKTNDPNFLEKIFLKFINDRRDIPFIWLCFWISLTTIPAAIYLFLMDEFNWWFALIYFAYNSIVLMGPYILMLHNTSHNVFFKRKYGILNRMMHWIIGPFFGETPESYFAHHIGMHHPENNLKEDLSSTLKYQRDSFIDFMKYYFTFMIFTVRDLASYLNSKGRKKIMKRFLVGETSWYVMVIILLFVNWQAALVVFVIPMVFTRLMMMAGNWAQHAFIDLENPDNCYRNSITCINSVYNKRCYNDGYHIGHHLKPSMHWTDMPNNFLENIDNYKTEEAIVFRKLDYFAIWLLLMTKSYKTLAKFYVNLNPELYKSESDIIELLKLRTKKLALQPQ